MLFYSQSHSQWWDICGKRAPGVKLFSCCLGAVLHKYTFELGTHENACLIGRNI